MLMLNNDNFEKDLQKIADESITLFTAAIGSVNISVANMIHLLIQNPESIKKIREEIKDLKQENGSYSLEDLNSMKYLGNCYQEGLRLCPPSGISL
jgi:cytochrome P450